MGRERNPMRPGGPRLPVHGRARPFLSAAAIVAALLLSVAPARATHNPSNTEVYVMNRDGSGKTNLSNSPGLDGSPAFSSDGTQIAFVSDRDHNWEIYVMNADGSGQTNVTNAGGNDDDPAWSSTDEIAFEGNEGIAVMNADGSGRKKLTFGRDPAWSADGSQLAFTRSSTMASDIYVINADGTGETALTDEPGEAKSNPTWSDGRIAFAQL